MALIWVEGFTGDKALAPLWRRYELAAARSRDTSLPDSDKCAASVEAEKAKTVYNVAVSEAEAMLTAQAASGQARTHALIVGIGNYKNAGIPALTTSVYGAWAFADWMLTSFQHPDRPLGSVELLLSPTDGLGDWKPSPEAAARLGLARGDNVPVEAATFANIRDAFKRWLKQAGALQENAAFFYFSGHGLWKLGTLLLPEDAQLATATQSFANLIDIRRTEGNMFNAQPSVQCFFVDSCQEITSQLLQNVDTNPGDPLHRPTNGGAIPLRDAWLYFGSCIGRRAYGPEDDAPFFTQELLACLQRRGARNALDDNTWSVTTDSLRTALEAASCCRRETEAKDIKFSWSSGTSCTFTAELCRIQGPPEVFVQVRCLPPETMLYARLYVESSGARRFRSVPLPTEWYITVAQGACLVGAEFDALTTTLAGRHCLWRSAGRA